MSIFALLARKGPQAQAGYVSVTSSGVVGVGSVTPDSSGGYASIPSGAMGPMAANSGVILLPGYGDMQMMQGFGIGGWSVPAPP